MKIVIDWDLCQGHANCTGDAPEVFFVDDDGKLHVKIPEPEESMRDMVELAASYCPTNAITIEG
ncbi:MAG: ferredoxin [Polyangiales bacterium]